MMFAYGDKVRVLGRHGNTVATGVVVGTTTQDRTHVSTRVKGRPLAVVLLDGGVRWSYPLARLRPVRAAETG